MQTRLENMSYHYVKTVEMHADWACAEKGNEPNYQKLELDSVCERKTNNKKVNQ